MQSRLVSRSIAGTTKLLVYVLQTMRVPTGIEGFDDLLAGGFPEGRLYVLSGPPGSGKTTFCSQFLATGGDLGDNCAYLSMHEPVKEIVSDMSRFDFNLNEHLRTGQIVFINILEKKSSQLLFAAREGDAPGSVESMTRRITSFVNSQKIDRVVIDSTMLLDYYFSDSLDSYVDFINSLKQSDATVLIVSEMTDPTTYTDLHYLSHGVVFLYNSLEEGRARRGVQIIKMGSTSIDGTIHKMEFTSKGLRVRPEQQIEVR